MVPKPELENIVNSDSRLEKKIFRFLEPLCVHYGYQKTQNLMPISNPLKKHEESKHEESWRAENFCTQYLKVKKYIIPTIFPTLITFFNGFEISIEFCVVLYP